MGMILPGKTNADIYGQAVIRARAWLGEKDAAQKLHGEFSRTK